MMEAGSEVLMHDCVSVCSQTVIPSVLCLSLALYSFSPAPFLSQLSQQTDVLLFEIELYSTVGVSRSKARLALMCFFSYFVLLPTVFHPHPTPDDVMPPTLLLLSHILSTNSDS